MYRVDGHREIFLNLINNLTVPEVERLLMIAWQLWNNRNTIVWRSNHLTAAQLIHRAVIFHAEWRDAHKPAKHSESRHQCHKWHAPAVDYVKIDVDNAVFADTLQTGIGLVIRDEVRSFVACRIMVRPGVLQAEEGEAWGILEALQWVQQLVLTQVIVELDAKLVNDALSEERGSISFW